MTIKTACWSLFLWTGALLATVQALSAQDVNQPPQTLDEEYARMAESVPGFGGLYLDEKGATHVYLKDPARARAVQSLLGKEVEVHQGEYDFRELFAWKETLRPQLALPGAVFLDIDEQRNRLVFGVEKNFLEAFSRELQGFSRQAKVPSKAVVIEATEPIVLLERLTDRIRPVPGGVQIGGCTLGFNAVRRGVRGFITNSHCTARRHNVPDGTVFFQSTNDGTSRIGVETADSSMFVGGRCPGGRLCSFADAAFVAYDSGELSARGQIARASHCLFTPLPPGLDPLEIFPSSPRLVVFGNLSATQGAALAKQGKSTGCTRGFQTQTCSDSNVNNTDITMLCQHRVSAEATFGDSGSPVLLFDPSLGGAFVAGILWGGSSGTFVYSPLANIMSELNIFHE